MNKEELRAFEFANRREIYAIHFASERAEGKEEGRAEGKEEKKRAIAKRMIRMGKSLKEVCEITELGTDIVQELAAQVTASQGQDA